MGLCFRGFAVELPAHFVFPGCPDEASGAGWVLPGTARVGTSASPGWVTGGWGLSLLPFQQMPLRRLTGKPRQRARKAERGGDARERRSRAELVIITGMSGSGKASVL